MPVRRYFTLVAFATITLLAGPTASARTQPVYDIIDKSIPLGSGRELSMDEVGEILGDAARTKGWSVAKVSDGYLRAEIHVRKHFAAIDIRYTPITYSMTYRDSLVLKYDGTKIHRNYNKWIKLIERTADQRFASE